MYIYGNIYIVLYIIQLYVYTHLISIQLYKCSYIYVCMCVYIYMDVCIYIYIYRERDSYLQISQLWFQLYIYIHTHNMYKYTVEITADISEEGNPHSIFSQLSISGVQSCRFSSESRVSSAHDYNHLRGSGGSLAVTDEDLITRRFGSQDSNPGPTTELGPRPLSPMAQTSLLAWRHGLLLKECRFGHKPARLMGDIMNLDMVQRSAMKMLKGKESLLFEDRL